MGGMLIRVWIGLEMKNSERIKHYEDCIKSIEDLLSYNVHGITKMKIRSFKYYIVLLRQRLKGG